MKWVLFLNCIFILNPLLGQNKYNNDPSIIKDPTGYKLRIGDSLRIAVRGETETAVDAIIDSEGKVRVVYLGELKISGMNSKQVEKLIVSEYQKNLIYQNPIVNVLITKYSDRVVFLSGSVNRKGPYTFPPEVEAMNIVEVIARAGGFTDIARKNKVFVTRTFYDLSGQVKDTKTYEVNVEALSTGNLLLGSANRFWIYPGDRIEVPERLI